MVIDILGDQWNKPCLACSMASGDSTPPGGVIKETISFILQQDLETPVKGFMVINSKQHIKGTSINCNFGPGLLRPKAGGAASAKPVPKFSNK